MSSIHTEFEFDDMAPLLGKLGAVYQEQPEQVQTTGGLTDRDRWLCLEAARYLEGQLEKTPAPFLRDCFSTAARELRRLSGH